MTALMQGKRGLIMLYYGIAPIAAATLLAFAALWISHGLLQSRSVIFFARSAVDRYPRVLN